MSRQTTLFQTWGAGKPTSTATEDRSSDQRQYGAFLEEDEDEMLAWALEESLKEAGTLGTVKRRF